MRLEVILIVAVTVVFTACAPSFRRETTNRRAVAPPALRWIPPEPKPVHVFGRYERRSWSAEDANKAPIPNMASAFVNASGDVVVWFAGGAVKSVLDGAWWIHADVLHELDAVSWGTLINGRYDDLVIEFWEPRAVGGVGAFRGSSDVVRLECGVSMKPLYRALTVPEMAALKARILEGGFRIIPLPAPRTAMPDTPCGAILERY